MTFGNGDFDLIEQLSNDIRDGTVRLFEAASIIDPTATKRSTIGLMLQHPSVRPWRRSIVWAIVEAIQPHWTGVWDSSADQVIERYRQFMQRVEELGLEADIDRPPILDVSDSY